MHSHSLEVTRRCTVYTFHLGPLRSPAQFVLGHMGPGWPPKQVGRNRACFKGAELNSRGVLVVLFLFIFRFSFSLCDS